MNKMIEDIKKTGIAEALAKACSSRLWNARLSLEDAGKNGFKSFAKEVEKARKAIDAAEEIWKASKVE